MQDAIKEIISLHLGKVLINENWNKTARNHTQPGIRTVDEVADADGDAHEDLWCDAASCGEQAKEHKV